MSYLKISLSISTFFLFGCYLNAHIIDLNSQSTSNLTNNRPRFADTLSYISTSEYYKGENFYLAPQFNSSVLKKFTISPALPNGIDLNESTGVIQGIPTEAKMSQTYTISASDDFSNFSTTVTFSVGLKFQVNSNADTSDLVLGNGECADLFNNCTLRAAIEELNSWSDIPRQILIPSMAITLEGSDITISKGITINGSGSSNTILQVGITSMRLFNINLLPNSETTIMNNLKIQNGKPNQNGGAILLNSGTLQINNSIFYNNITYSGYDGGAIATIGGDLKIKDSIFESNQTTTIGSGGALSLNHTSNSTIIENSNFLNNHAQRNGGAIYTNGLVGNFGTLTIINSTFENNSGSNKCGGVYISAGNFKIINSTVTQNIGPSGQIYIQSANCSTSDNCEINQTNIFTSTNLIALRFEDFPQFSILNSSIIGGATTLSPAISYIGVTSPPNLLIKNTIVSNPNGGPSCNYSLTSLGYNISSASDCNLNQLSDQTNQSHLSIFSTGILTNLGGNQKVIELKNPGPAIDKGPVDCSLNTDIRGTGFLRPINKNLGNFCDIGAYEAQ